MNVSVIILLNEMIQYAHRYMNILIYEMSTLSSVFINYKKIEKEKLQFLTTNKSQPEQ